MLPVLLAGASAVVWGAADFCGGVASLRGKSSLRDRALTVAVLAHICALPVILPFLFWVPGSLTGPAMLWGAAAGLASLAGIVALNLGLASGAMATVAPVAAVTAALVPLIGGLLTGDRPAFAAVIGAIAAVGAIILVSGGWQVDAAAAGRPQSLAPQRDPGRRPSPRPRRTLPRTASERATSWRGGADRGGLWRPGPRPSGLWRPGPRPSGLWRPGPRPSGRPDAARTPMRGGGPRAAMTPQVLALSLGSGVAFGLFFLLLGQAGREAGMWPLIADKAVSVLLGLALLRGCGVAFAPVSRMVLVLAGLAGSFDAVATALYLMSSHTGQVSIVAPVAALYPASTVMLALIFNRERLRPVQWSGLGLAGVALVLVAT